MTGRWTRPVECGWDDWTGFAVGSIGAPGTMPRHLAEQVLTHGRLTDTGRTIGGTSNVNGALAVVHAELDGVGLDAVSKPAGAQGVQEFVAPRVGRLFGVGHLFPATVMREGGALIALVPGTTAKGAGVTSVATLDAALGAMHVQAGSPLGIAELAARRDRQLLGAFDYVLANDDRHPANLMVSREAVSAVDQGSIGNGEMPDPLVPRLGPWYQGSDQPGHAALGSEALAVVRAIDPAALRAELAGLTAAHAAVGAADRLLPGVASERYAARALQRLEHLQQRGGYRWASSLDTPSPDPRILASAHTG